MSLVKRYRIGDVAIRLLSLLINRVPLREALSLLYQYKYSRNGLLRFGIDGDTYCFVRDPATLVYGYGAVQKIRGFADALKNEKINTLVDVGANNGWFSTCVAKTNPGIHCCLIEPNTELGNAIEENLSSRHVNYSVHFLGISDCCGKARFNIASSNSQLSSLIRGAVTLFSDSKTIEEREIRVQTLDHFCQANSIEAIDLLKVDIQGAEHLLLDGAQEILKRTRMALFEISFIERHAVDVFNQLCREFENYQVMGPVSHGADILFSRESKPDK